MHVLLAPRIPRGHCFSPSGFLFSRFSACASHTTNLAKEEILVVNIFVDFHGSWRLGLDFLTKVSSSLWSRAREDSLKTRSRYLHLHLRFTVTSVEIVRYHTNCKNLSKNNTMVFSKNKTNTMEYSKHPHIKTPDLGGQAD